MKIITTIDESISDERIEIYAQKNYPEIHEIKRIAEGSQRSIVGFLPDGSFKALDISDINCFTIIAGRLTAKTAEETYTVKKRLYEMENILTYPYCKISQSCIVNLNNIELFEVSINGSLKCKFKNGDFEYVSRRFIKNLKERLGL